MIRTSTTIRRTAPHRHGILLLDMLLGITALVVIMAGTLVLIAGFRRQRMVNHEYFLATQYLANALEEIDAAELATQDRTSLENVALTNEILRDLPGARLKVEIDRVALHHDNSESGKAVDPRQITCHLIWQSDNSATPPHQTSLTMWKSLTVDSDNSAARKEDTP